MTVIRSEEETTMEQWRTAFLRRFYPRLAPPFDDLLEGGRFENPSVQAEFDSFVAGIECYRQEWVRKIKEKVADLEVRAETANYTQYALMQTSKAEALRELADEMERGLDK